MVGVALFGGAVTGNSENASNQSYGAATIGLSTICAIADKRRKTNQINGSIESFHSSWDDFHINGYNNGEKTHITMKPLLSLPNASLPLLGLGEALIINGINSAAAGEGTMLAINVATGVGILAMGLAAEFRERQDQIRIKAQALQSLNNLD